MLRSVGSTVPEVTVDHLLSAGRQDYTVLGIHHIDKPIVINNNVTYQYILD